MPIGRAFGAAGVEAGVPRTFRRRVVIRAIPAHSMPGQRRIHPIVRLHKELPETNTAFAGLVRAGDGPLHRDVLLHGTRSVVCHFMLVPRGESLLEASAEELDPK